MVVWLLDLVWLSSILLILVLVSLMLIIVVLWVSSCLTFPKKIIKCLKGIVLHNSSWKRSILLKWWKSMIWMLPIVVPEATDQPVTDK
ncbi:hypothetical protein BC941DRAFT_101128 [Chlamydoabsidia padenii]|nr:hypothetical protein BC941DRAFT_101128 [Chlamydoabsidia padenii]